MAVCPHPVGGGGQRLPILGPEDGGVRDGVDSADKLHLIAGLGVHKHLLNLYLRLEQHLQIYVLNQRKFLSHKEFI